MMRSAKALCFALCLASGAAWAAQVKVSRPQLCEVSDLVVLAEVTSGETRWATGTAGAIERVRWLHVHDLVRGSAGDTIEVILPGGTIGGTGQWVEDVPELLGNTTYLLFLDVVGTSLQVIGGDQGAVRVARRPGERGEPIADVLASVEVCRG
jgi:hypothetical protein